MEALAALRAALLGLHAALVEHERAPYERLHGRVSSGELLRLTIGDPWFAWLRPLSELIVAIDEALAGEEPPSPEESRSLARFTSELVSPSGGAAALGAPYGRALQEGPAVVLAHGAVRRALAAWPA